jgi:hypothetical protein
VVIGADHEGKAGTGGGSHKRNRKRTAFSLLRKRLGNKSRCVGSLSFDQAVAGVRYAPGLSPVELPRMTVPE